MHFGSFAENLAGKVRENINVTSSSALIAKLGEVVAPMGEESEESEYETDSGSEYEEYDEIEVDGVGDENSNEEEEIDFANNNAFENNISSEETDIDDVVNGGSSDLEDEKLNTNLKNVELGDSFSSTFGLNKHAPLSSLNVVKQNDSGISSPTQNPQPNATRNDIGSSMTSTIIESSSNYNQSGIQPSSNDDMQENTGPVSHDSNEYQVNIHLTATERIKDDDKISQMLSKQTKRESLSDETNNRDEAVVGNSKVVDMEDRIQEMMKDNEQQHSKFLQNESRMKRLLQESNNRCNDLEKRLHNAIVVQKNTASSQDQKQQRAQFLYEQTLAETSKKHEESRARIQNLEHELEGFKAILKQTNERLASSEKEKKEVLKENKTLKQQINDLKLEKNDCQQQIHQLREAHAKTGGLQMELHLLKEERSRERAQIQSTVETASSNITKVSSERDEARSKAQSLQQQLEATNADLELAKKDFERVLLVNGNLQTALEAFQNERDAEFQLLEEHKVKAEEVLKSANKAKIDAIREENEQLMKEVQYASDMAVKNAMEEISILEKSVEKSRLENVNLRRSLDEAIQRLQISQDDVIDRVLMKNILLDWHSKRGQSRKQVLELMASVLHFNEDEKASINLVETTAVGAIGKVVGAVAAPLPPAALNIDKLEGENVREKWVNFLLAETGGEINESEKNKFRSDKK